MSLYVCVGVGVWCVCESVRVCVCVHVGRAWVAPGGILLLDPFM